LGSALSFGPALWSIKFGATFLLKVTKRIGPYNYKNLSLNNYNKAILFMKPLSKVKFQQLRITLLEDFETCIKRE